MAALCLQACSTSPSTTQVLYDFESDDQLDAFHWKCHTLFSIADAYATHGEKSLKLTLFPSAYPGWSPALKQHNWRGYQSLRLDIYNPEQMPVDLTVRIDDTKKETGYTNRYNKTFQLVPGENTIEILLDSLTTSVTGRPLNLETIHRFMVFVVRPDKKITLYLDNFRLIPFNL